MWAWAFGGMKNHPLEFYAGPMDGDVIVLKHPPAEGDYMCITPKANGKTYTYKFSEDLGKLVFVGPWETLAEA